MAASGETPGRWTMALDPETRGEGQASRAERHAERAGWSVPRFDGAGSGYVSRRVAAGEAGDRAARSRSAPTRTRLILLGKIVGLVDQAVIRVLHDLISARQ